jgi:hypothetical protein
MRMRIPSSMTRFVEANINATTAVKCAPFLNSALAAASAANEHDEFAAPNAVDIEMLLAPGFPTIGVRRDFGTKACIIPLMP